MSQTVPTSNNPTFYGSGCLIYVHWCIGLVQVYTRLLGKINWPRCGPE